ncbi:MAG: DUF6807 family protein, partial [Thermoguttaceae bacterium]
MHSCQRPYRAILVPLVLLALASPVFAADGYRWKAEAGKSLALLRGDVVLWQFCYAPEQPKPFFHPVALDDGRVLTWNSPPDHRWHHGLWFSWKFINGLNYWEPDASGKPAGSTRWENVDIRTGDDGSARIAMDLSYAPGGKPALLTERRVVEVTAPAADGTYAFDWVCRFTAGAGEVQFDRTPLPGEPGGQPFGGYAGLSVRFAQDLAEPQAATAEGPVQFGPESRFRGKSIAMDYNGLVQAKPCGIAILDHPQNLNHPSPWYAIRSAPMAY